MPRDKRLYMTFPIDFADHPKVEQLSDLAFRAFVAMNGYSRVHRLDGRIPIPVAVKRWGKRALAELVSSDDGRPLVMLEEVYVIRDYAEHQFTTADEEELHIKRSVAGAKGGKAKANALALAIALAKQSSGKNVAESESGLKIQTDVTDLTGSSQVSDGSNSGLDAINDVVQQRAWRAGIRNLAAVRDSLTTTTEHPVSMLGAVLLAEAIMSKSKRPVDNVDAYVAQVCRRSAAEVQQAYFDLDIGAVA